ncbi:MAG: 50S ribosomal protein L25 [Chloroflexota bacterium]|nr:50S ribosomal protein L25 [Chloroflexia bacterium]MDQ3442370.1 50S ribosomal protein L25 [Chloroflexota bacterium]
MSDELILRAEPREIHGKKVKRLRREGLVPGVVYGPVVSETVSVSVNRREFERFFSRNGHSTITSLEWAGGKQPVLIREVQIDPVTRAPLHIDFFAPNMRVVLRQFVPIVMQHAGDHDGVLQTVLTEVEVEALPSNLPHQIDVDISHLVTVGDAIHVSDVTLPDDVTVITAPEDLIASLVAEAVEEEPEETVEPEVAEGEGGEAAEGESTDSESEDQDA